MASAASYRCDLGNSRAIYLSNQGVVTMVTVYSGGAGQQQQSSQGFSTGEWTATPKLYQVGGGYVVTVFAEQTFYFLVQGGQMQVSSGTDRERIAQGMSGLEPLPMVEGEMPSAPGMAGMKMKGMEPMTQMQPMTMTMGNMSMSMGEMRMGNMRLSTQADQAQGSSAERSEGVVGQGQGGSAEGVESEVGQKKFCSQCGAKVQAGDRFCSQCGNQLT